MMMNSGSQITMADHIAELNQLFFFHLRWLRTVKQSLMLDTTKTLVHALLAVLWMAATVYLLVSAVKYYKSLKGKIKVVPNEHWVRR